MRLKNVNIGRQFAKKKNVKGKILTNIANSRTRNILAAIFTNLVEINVFMGVRNICNGPVFPFVLFGIKNA